MRFIAAVFLLMLILTPQAAAIERFELDGEISLILTSPRPTYYIMTFVNKNDFNVTLVPSVQVNFTYTIDPARVSAADNYNQTVVPDAIGEESITVTYNNTLPALGYGKIFISLDTPAPQILTSSTSSTTTSSTSTSLESSTTTSSAPTSSTQRTTTTTVLTRPDTTLPPATHAPVETLSADTAGDDKTALPVSIFLVFILPVIVVLIAILNHFLPSQKSSETRR